MMMWLEGVRYHLLGASFSCPQGSSDMLYTVQCRGNSTTYQLKGVINVDSQSVSIIYVRYLSIG